MLKRILVELAQLGVATGVGVEPLQRGERGPGARRHADLLPQRDGRGIVAEVLGEQLRQLAARAHEPRVVIPGLAALDLFFEQRAHGDVRALLLVERDEQAPRVDVGRVELAHLFEQRHGLFAAPELLGEHARDGQQELDPLGLLVFEHQAAAEHALEVIEARGLLVQPREPEKRRHAARLLLEDLLVELDRVRVVALLVCVERRRLLAQLCRERAAARELGGERLVFPNLAEVVDEVGLHRELGEPPLQSLVGGIELERATQRHERKVARVLVLDLDIGDAQQQRARLFALAALLELTDLLLQQVDGALPVARLLVARAEELRAAEALARRLVQTTLEVCARLAMVGRLLQDGLKLRERVVGLLHVRVEDDAQAVARLQRARRIGGAERGELTLERLGEVAPALLLLAGLAERAQREHIVGHELEQMLERRDGRAVIREPVHLDGRGLEQELSDEARVGAAREVGASTQACAELSRVAHRAIEALEPLEDAQALVARRDGRARCFARLERCQRALVRRGRAGWVADRGLVDLGAALRVQHRERVARHELLEDVLVQPDEPLDVAQAREQTLGTVAHGDVGRVFAEHPRERHHGLLGALEQRLLDLHDAQP